MYKIVSWSVVILWMALIFYLSHQPASVSNELSTGITEVIVKTVAKVAPNAEFDIRSFNHIMIDSKTETKKRCFHFLTKGVSPCAKLRAYHIVGGNPTRKG